MAGDGALLDKEKQLAEGQEGAHSVGHMHKVVRDDIAVERPGDRDHCKKTKAGIQRAAPARASGGHAAAPKFMTQREKTMDSVDRVCSTVRNVASGAPNMMTLPVQAKPPIRPVACGVGDTVKVRRAQGNPVKRPSHACLGKGDAGEFDVGEGPKDHQGGGGYGSRVNVLRVGHTGHTTWADCRLGRSPGARPTGVWVKA